MDGSTKAATHCAILTTLDVDSLFPRNNESYDPPPDILRSEGGRLIVDVSNKEKKHLVLGIPQVPHQKESMFVKCMKTVKRMKDRGFLDKPWILLPLNLSNTHWVFVAILNMTYIGTPQDEKFSGFLYYDSLEENVSRTKVMLYLHNKGVINMIVYANFVYGNPILNEMDIRELLWNPETFPKIEIPTEDYVGQHDGWNCGLFVCLNMMEMSLVHSLKYQKREDFHEVVEDPEDGAATYCFQQGDWYKVFSSRRPPGMTLRPAKGDSTYMESLLQCFRQQMLCLWNRIQTLKNRKNYNPSFPDSVVPPYFQKTHRLTIWDIQPGDQKMIDLYKAWLRNSKDDLKQFQSSKNKYLSNPEIIAATDDEDDDNSLKSSEKYLPVVTVEQLQKAGMNQTVIDISADDDDETLQKKLSDDRKQHAAKSMSPVEDDRKPAGKILLVDFNDTHNNECSNKHYFCVTAKPSNATESKAGRKTLNTTGATMGGKTLLSHDDNNDDDESEDDEETEAEESSSSETSPQHKPPSKKALASAKKQPMTKAERKSIPPAKPPAKKRKRIRKNKARKRPRTDNKAGDPQDTSNMEDVDFDRPVPLPNSRNVHTEVYFQKRYAKRDKKFYATSQRTYEAAEAAVFKMAGLPNGDDEYKEWYKTIDVKKKRETKKKKEERVAKQVADYDRFKNYSAIETFLHMFNTVKALQFVPPPDGSDHVGKGHFNVMLVENDEIVPDVSRDWVMKNFEEDVVDSVVNLSLGQFVQVPKKVKITMDGRQVQKLRYFPAVPKRNNNEQDKEEYFQGTLSNEATVRLTADYVRKNFPKKFVDFVVEQGVNRVEQFFHVPPGAPRTMDDHIIVNERFPRLEYRQGGDFTCLFSSFASALHYIGLRTTAKDVADFAKTFSAQDEYGVWNWKGLKAIMDKSCRWLQGHKLNNHSFNIFTDISKYPTVMCLEAEDGSTQHAITVVGKLIFDSNIPRAIPLTRPNLNYCCSSKEIPNGVFKRVYLGFRYKDNPNSKIPMYDNITKKNNVNFFMDESFDDDE